ncbi:unnamed protein product [Diamesa serratosioi]
MWAPILANFFHIIFVIFGFFGAYQFRGKYLISYSVWNVIWIGWNSFLICFYLNVGILDRDSDILNLGTGSVSWFEVNGPGCKPNYSINITSDDPYRPIRPERVDGCIVEYQIVEVIHSFVQNFLSLLGLIGAICIGRILWDDDDSLSRDTKQKQRQTLYSIEFGTPVDAIRHSDDLLDPERADSMSPKPMTPRRVKRRSTRGTSSRQSRRSDRGGAGASGSTNTHRSSTRSSRRKIHQNPVTKLIEQQNSFPSFKHNNNSNLTENNLKSLNNDYILNNQYHHHPLMKKETPNLIPPKPKPPMNSFQKQSIDIITTPPSIVNRQTPPDPIYHNFNTSSPLIQQQTSWNTSSPPSPQIYNNHYHHHHPAESGGLNGHINPSYQHSTPNLNDVPDIDEYYTNRPPSVRSSYSNFHGTRPLSYNPNGPSTTSRESLRFLTGGPPAYNLNYHTPPDSETTM